jgi:hypothetical protein
MNSYPHNCGAIGWMPLENRPQGLEQLFAAVPNNNKLMGDMVYF